MTGSKSVFTAANSIDERHPEKNDSHLVETFHLREKLLSVCTAMRLINERREVFNQLIICIGLVQIEARYHDKCRIQFFSISLSATVSDKKGQPVNDTRMYYFEKVCAFLGQEGDMH